MVLFCRRLDLRTKLWYPVTPEYRAAALFLTTFCRGRSYKTWELLKPARRGSTVLDVDGEGIEIGDGLVIGNPQGDMEPAIVAGKGSIILDRPLVFDHPAGTQVLLLPESYVDLLDSPAGIAGAGTPGESDSVFEGQGSEIEESGGISRTTFLILLILLVAVAFVILLIKKMIRGAMKIVLLLVVILLIAVGVMLFSGGEKAQPTSSPLSKTHPPINQAPQTTTPPTIPPATTSPTTLPETTSPPPQATLPPETSPPTTVIQTTTTLPPTTIPTTTTTTTTTSTTTTTTALTTTTTEAKPTLELVDETLVDNVEDKFWLGGKVRNNGETEVYSVRVRITLYNDMHAELQTLNSVPIDRIGPGETVEFNTIKSDKVITAVARYEVTILTGE
jgi:hypothetical protein